MASKIPAPIIAAAQNSARKWGIPASVSLAQWAVESGWGKHQSAPHNWFGIKARKGDPAGAAVSTGEHIKGKDVTITTKFRAFGSDVEAFDYHAELLRNAGAYAHARATLPDPIAFAHALTGVYATDPNYGRTLESVINGSENLRQYDVV